MGYEVDVEHGAFDAVHGQADALHADRISHADAGQVETGAIDLVRMHAHDATDCLDDAREHGRQITAKAGGDRRGKMARETQRLLGPGEAVVPPAADLL